MEEGIPAPQLIKVYANTPQSLGGCTILDEELMHELLRIGQAAGPVLGYPILILLTLTVYLTLV